jgi:hypothetical protein
MATFPGHQLRQHCATSHAKVFALLAHFSAYPIGQKEIFYWHKIILFMGPSTFELCGSIEQTSSNFSNLFQLLSSVGLFYRS